MHLLRHFCSQRRKHGPHVHVTRCGQVERIDVGLTLVIVCVIVIVVKITFFKKGGRCPRRAPVVPVRMPVGVLT